LEEPNGLRKALKLGERLGELALSEPGKRCFIEFRVDVLQAVPVKAIPVPEFQRRRWPQLRRQVTERRRALRTLLDRAKAAVPATPSAKARR
jgi:hypothetical protein